MSIKLIFNERKIHFVWLLSTVKIILTFKYILDWSFMKKKYYDAKMQIYGG